LSSRDDALGLERGHAIVVPYDQRWPALFEELAAQIKRVAGDRILGVEHVGSTSIPGTAAKPILDILVSVADFEKARELVPDLAALGFEFRPNEEIPDRHYFRRLVGSVRTHHLSLAEPSSRHYRVTLAFRDTLRSDRTLAQAYENLKLDLARRYPRDREAYTNGKTEFVLNVLRSCGLS
jgi:GrpB-like predicted nucleotidyltransferase (UPF0157 family)